MFKDPAELQAEGGKLLNRAQRIAISSLLLIVGVVDGCNSGSSAFTPTVITPSQAVLSAGQTLQFSASVGGAVLANPQWSVNTIPGGNAATGIITPSGSYTAPVNSNARLVEITVTGSGVKIPGSASVYLFQPNNLQPGVVAPSRNPQVAIYAAELPQGASMQVEFGTTTNYGLTTWTQPAPWYGGVVSILVAGMRGFTTYHLRADIGLSDGTKLLDQDHTFTTGGLPTSRIPPVAVTLPTGATPSSGIELLDIYGGSIPSTGPVTAAAFDLEGNLIWFNDLQDTPYLDSPFPIKPLPNGHFLVVYNSATANGVREIDLAGNVVFQISNADVGNLLVQGGLETTKVSLHHDILPLQNGHLILLANTTKTYTDLAGYPGSTVVTGDVIIDLDQNRQPVWFWSTFDHLDINRHPLTFPDWTHSNALIYSPDDGNLILSMRNQNWIIKINYQDGRGDGSILWRLGAEGDFVIPGGLPSDYNYAQHYPILTSTHSTGIFPLMLFDNGNNRIMDSSGTVCGSLGAPACYSRPVLFELDEDAKTATISWQYDLPVFSLCCGSIGILQNGDAEYDIAINSTGPTVSRIQEVTMDSIPQLVWQMDITGQYGQLVYRGFRIPSLYPGVEWTQSAMIKANASTRLGGAP